MSRVHSMFVAICVLAGMSLSHQYVKADDIAFDLPSSIECRDVTPDQFALANPQLKQIEVKVRISARELKGDTSGILQFDYEIRIGEANRVIDFSPKTLLESTVVEDRIEITAAVEDSKASGADAAVGFNPVAIGGSHNSTAKKSEAKHFKQVVAKDVVLASGTIEREHGVFFRIRPSRTATFEGSREFLLIVAVPQAWHAGMCKITCTAKLAKHSLMSESVVSIGGQQTEVGMFLLGDAEALATAEQLRNLQNVCERLSGGGDKKSNLFHAISTGTENVFARSAMQRKRAKLQQATKALDEVRARLVQLSAALVN
jgi:hypothetical protein